MSSALHESPAESWREDPAVRDIDWQDFRDHLATADSKGHRRWVYARKPVGKFYRWRTYLSWLLLGFLFAGPFINISGNPILMLNVVDRKFSILGQIFWPQDSVIFVLGLLIFFMSIMVFTGAFGRLWCGWVCPHTIFQEMLFRRIEFWIDGDAAAQRALNRKPLTLRKVARRAVKHSIYLGLSFLIGNLFLAYIIGADALLKIVTAPPLEHLAGLGFMLVFTMAFYFVFSRFREQACTFICPYGRLQSTVLDENTMVVAYDYKRGEKRSHLTRNVPPAVRQQKGLGDCIDCRLCVAVCPTGIDIRNGTQMECVHCTACMDACDGVMMKIGRPRGLVRYASLNSIERGERMRFTPRMGWYTAILAVLVAVLGFFVFTRSDVETMLLRAPGALYQQASNGEIQNLYTIKVVNKTNGDIPIELKLENVAGHLQLMGASVLIIPRAGLAQSSLLVRLEPGLLQQTKIPLIIGVYSGKKRLETIRTSFVGPRAL